MNAAHGWSLITVGAVSVIAGSAVLWASSRRCGQRRPQSRVPASDLLRALTCTAVGGAVIAGVQWALLSHTSPGAVWVAVLSLPAFLAAATVWRLLAVRPTVAGLQGPRAIPRGRGWR